MKNKKASAIGGVKQTYIHMANSMRKHPINTVTHIMLLNCMQTYHFWNFSAIVKNNQKWLFQLNDGRQRQVGHVSHVQLSRLQLYLLATNLKTEGKKGNGLFNDALNTFYLRLYGVGHMVKDYSIKERDETHCLCMAYSFWLTTRVLVYAPSNWQDNTYHGLC